jgi:hypothetical protein
MSKPVSKNPFKSVDISLAFPSEYQEPTQEICLKILEHISDGKSLKKISQLEGMPTFGQLNAWIWRYPEFGQAVVLARSANAHHHIDRIVEIMDDVEAGVLETDKANTLIAGNRWLAQHLNPDIYGDRKNVKGQVDLNAQITVVTGVPEPKSKVIDHDTQKPIDP